MPLCSFFGVGRQQIVEFVPVAPNMVEEKVEFLDRFADGLKFADEISTCWSGGISSVLGSFGRHSLIAVARWQDTTTNPQGIESGPGRQRADEKSET